MTKSISRPLRGTSKPRCNALARGVLGAGISGNSAEGKFLRRVEGELTAHVGGRPSFPQVLLIRRVSRAMLRLEQLDAKMAGDTWTDYDGRVFGGLSNSLRLMLRELGLKAPPPKPATLADIAARHRPQATMAAE